MSVLPTPFNRNVDNPISPWWLVLIEGIAAIVVGIWLLVAPVRSTLILVQVMAWFWIIDGIMNLVLIFVDRRAWGWKLFMGILGILAGFWIVSNPVAGAVTALIAVIVVLAVQAIIYGVVALVAAFQGAGVGSGVIGALSIVLGVLLLMEPWLSAMAIPWVYGVFAIAGGLVAIWAAFRQRSQVHKLAQATTGPVAMAR